MEHQKLEKSILSMHCFDCEANLESLAGAHERFATVIGEALVELRSEVCA